MYVRELMPLTPRVEPEGKGIKFQGNHALTIIYPILLASYNLPSS